MLDSISIPGLNIDCYLKLIQNPYDTQTVFDLIKTLVSADNFATTTQCFAKSTENDLGLQELYAHRYMPKFPTNAELLDCPADSLGRGLAEHLIKNNITLDFQGIEMSNIYDKQESFQDYARIRTVRVHDILHVVTGYDTSPIGEGQVAAFQAAQYGTAIHAILLSFLTTHVVFYDSQNLHTWLHRMNEALTRGRHATPCYGVPWENYFSESLSSVRKRFGLVEKK